MAGRRLRMLLYGLVAGLVFLAACGQASVPVPVSGAVKPAPVTSVEVLQAVSGSGELRAVVKGLLPDGCTRVLEPAVDPARNLIVVILPMQSTGGKDCGETTTFERTVVLGRNLPPGKYTVLVNGVQTVVNLQGVPVAQAPSATALVSAAVAPTATLPPLATPTAGQPAAAQPTPTTTPLPTAQPTATQTPAATQPAGSGATSGATTGSTTGQAAADCVNKAAFFADLTVPDGTIFDPGQVFTKSWRLRNAGTCAWTHYSLVYQDGDPLGAGSSQVLPGPVAPGSTVDVGVKMVAPQKPGGYYSNWLLSTTDGSLFGLGAAGNGLLWTKIGVRTLIPITSGQPSCAYQTDASVEAQVLQLINQARQDHGLPPFKLIDKISTAARLHSQDMACNDFVEHYGSDGSTWYGRIQAQGVKYGTASENIYAGNPQFGGTAQGAFNWWMNSQIHRDNILNPKSSAIGVGYVYFDGSTYKGYYTLDFIGP